MARTALTVQPLVLPIIAANFLTLTLTAADTVNLNAVVSTGKEILIAQNIDTVSHNVTINSVADELGRTGDLTDAIAAGAIRVYGEFPQYGWMQSDGMLHFQADNAKVLFAIIQGAR